MPLWVDPDVHCAECRRFDSFVVVKGPTADDAPEDNWRWLALLILAAGMSHSLVPEQGGLIEQVNSSTVQGADLGDPGGTTMTLTSKPLQPY